MEKFELCWNEKSLIMACSSTQRRRFVCLFFTRSGRPALASVPDTVNCRILTTPGANSCNQHFSLNGDITQGGHPSKYWLSRCCCTSVFEIEGTGVSKSLGRWLWNLVCFVWSDNLVRSADVYVIWVAWHKVTRPQTILKFRPPSSLDYRTRHGSQSSAKTCLRGKTPPTAAWETMWVQWNRLKNRVWPSFSGIIILKSGMFLLGRYPDFEFRLLNKLRKYNNK
jgi:hypothetical protein